MKKWRCLCLAILVSLAACVGSAQTQQVAPAPLKLNESLTAREVAGPTWAKNEPIYEVNLDLYKFPKGTSFREYEKHLPVLKELGVGLIWFMPLHPRGQKKAFGSPYAVREYTQVNPDFGTQADFKHLVQEAHRLGLRILINWVPNHSSWDNPWMETHPDFYAKNDHGEIKQAFDWTDVAQLDYGTSERPNQPLWNAMRDAMIGWVCGYDIDGFRCDVAGSAGKVPLGFWQWVRPQLDATEPVFMLAEAEDAYLHPAFDMTYSWKMPPILWDVCAGRKPATAIDEELQREARDFPTGAILMRFIDNHDWHRNADWLWGGGTPIDTAKGMPQVAPLMVLCATLPGKPLLYNGQEMAFTRTDPPADAEGRTTSPVWSFYRSLLQLYRAQPALYEGSFSKISTSNDGKVYAFIREKDKKRVLVLVNLSERSQDVTLKNDSLAGIYQDHFAGLQTKLPATPSWKLEPWAYRIYVSH